MQTVHILLFIIAAAAFVAAAFLGATPPAARLNNVGLAVLTAALAPW